MNYKELRPGNIILNNYTGKWEQMEVDIPDLLLIKKNPEKFKAVLLTKEILLKNSFKIESSGNEISYDYYALKNSDNNNLDYLHLRHYKISAFYLLGRMHKEYFEDYLQNDNKIFYLHHLQNLYFVLKNKELIFSKF